MARLVFDSPIGKIEIVGDENFIHEVEFRSNAVDPIEKAPELLQRAKKQLEEYFAGERKNFQLPLQQQGTEFQQKVWNELCRIPYGKTISYLELAQRLGDEKVIRAAGTANGKNKIAIIVPCHRVIGSDGSLTGYAGGLHRKEWLLRHEKSLPGMEQMDLFK
ncbi:MAG TPA: methylated-DNA--[protein]-cysteine S-methyltransferase [Bacteroidia bacterium]|jgi:methylated-DNA-[protein]-cysteine S-methyltransferase|nr:methylated-DNA--[protein]-cysteine S-methyltransferase [Bacteroidia bacterium]